ncbi:MAG: DNA polymerase I [Candidatus Omnitrophica bacterium]|nr:DNA polymerase I [Candidatus Omnitrophota bacterium]
MYRFSKKIYLVDGTSLCYRSFFALKLSTSNGLPTGAIYGFLQTLQKIQKKFSPHYIGICFDVSRKTFRQDMFVNYKINRPPTPDGLKVQIPIIKEIIQALGMKIIEKEGLEADDLIASLTKKAIGENLPVIIVSSDKDIYQLLDDAFVNIYNPSTEKLITKDDFLKEFGFSSNLIVDWLALVGDNVDNVPGAKGVGKVTAAKLIKEFKTIENIFKNLDSLSPKLQEILKKEKENVFLSKELVKLKIVDLEIDWGSLEIKEPDYQKIYNICKELEFKSIVKDLSAPKLNLQIDIKEVSSDKLKEAIKDNLCIFTLDTTNFYLFNLDKNSIYKSQINEALFILEDETIKKISFDIKEKLHLLDKIFLKGIYFDIMVAAYLLEPTLLDYSLNNLVSFYLGQFLQDIPIQVQAYFIYKLYLLLLERLKAENLMDLFLNVEMPLIQVLYQMEKAGVMIDKDKLEDLLSEVDNKINQIQTEIFSIANKQFNLNSPQQLSTVLFKELKIPPIKTTKTGYSTSEEVLEKLALQYKIAKLILEYRQLNKLKTTYINPIKNMLIDGKLYAKFNQTSTQTGRLSSHHPNLQSIPAKNELSTSLRKVFISSFKDGYILSADYSQIELRILAHFSSDKNLITAFKEDLDIHTYTASLLFGIPQKQINEKQRDLAKRINFSIIYGMTAYGLAEELNISLQEAQSFIDNYFLRYSGVKEYINKVYKEAMQFGFVKTILGRKRKLPDINSANFQLKEAAYRQAINTPIQGSCADLIKVAMINIYKQFKEKKLQAKLIIQIHDELIFDVPASELNIVKDIVKKYMQESLPLSIPIKVAIKVGKNWAELEEINQNL